MMGFAGSVNGDEPHLASTYAACCALCLLYDETTSNSANNRNMNAKRENYVVNDDNNNNSNGSSSNTQWRRGNYYLRSLPRIAIKRWLLHLRNDFDGSFYVHDGGEADIRASYCVAVIVTLLDLDNPESFTSLDMREHNAVN